MGKILSFWIPSKLFHPQLLSLWSPTPSFQVICFLLFQIFSHLFSFSPQFYCLEYYPYYFFLELSQKLPSQFSYFFPVSFNLHIRMPPGLFFLKYKRANTTPFCVFQWFSRELDLSGSMYILQLIYTYTFSMFHFPRLYQLCVCMAYLGVELLPE